MSRQHSFLSALLILIVGLLVVTCAQPLRAQHTPVSSRHSSVW
ncbi:hypothetical protein [Siphonobacter aquaeclarae]|uniref:Uncharacterized protein n=1 Tax=Siphonobacter aquaeclarae TaxID=563176 RepID=A0A1G9PII1_9BACT|nr:hypothetical protein [Siphonobacter aquaeclarae]SDL98608.1 hypothetical protein SAMN04488090_2195 [Siphonobacter aquaeclarae]